MQSVTMASRSSLSESKSLVFKTDFIKENSRENIFYFTLMNEEWKLVTYYKLATHECTTFMYPNIPNISSVSFDVLTFLEDNRNNLEMYCSKTTVLKGTGGYRDLYSGYSYRIKDALLMSELNNINIVCTFDPSSIITVDKETSSLEIRQSLVWSFQRLDIHKSYESPVFGLINSTWKLGIRSTNVKASLPTWEIYLKNCSGMKSFEPFEIKTLMEDKKHPNVRLQCCRTYVYSPYETLYKEKFDTIRKKLPDLRLYDDLRIVCIFDSSIKSTFILRNEGMEKATTCLKDNGGSSNVKNTLMNQSSGHLFNFQNLSEDLGHLLEKKLFSDINLKCDTDIIPAHKNVLAARSEVFSSMFQHDMAESRTGNIDIKDIEPSILRIFLKYLYSGKIPETVTADMICKLYAASDKYAVRSLQKICSCYMAKIADVGNFLSFLMLAEAHNDPELKNAISEFVIERPALMKKDDWMRYSEKCPVTANEIYKKYALKCIP